MDPTILTRNGNMSLPEAIAAPRPLQRGHKIRAKPGFQTSRAGGDAQGIDTDEANGARIGASDPRGGGAVAGY